MLQRKRWYSISYDTVIKSIQCNFDRQFMNLQTLLQTIFLCDCVCCDEVVFAASYLQIFAEPPMLGDERLH